jgi:F-type H+-transporting ATPase subunit a
LDFSNRYHAILFHLGDTPVYLTDTLIATWVIMGILILLAVVVRVQLCRFGDVPGAFQNAVESAVEVMESFTNSTMGPGSDAFAPYFFGVFLFILLSNYSGLFGLRQPTADLATTGALALMTFGLIHFRGIRIQKWDYVKAYFSPHPVMLPINLVGEISKPISLAFRLFGNVLGGVIIMTLVYGMLPLALRIVLPDILHAYFDVFSGSLQAFIFTILSMTFIAEKSVVSD